MDSRAPIAILFLDSKIQNQKSGKELNGHSPEPRFRTAGGPQKPRRLLNLVERRGKRVKMDLNQQDKAVLRARRCPDCGQPINSYFFEPQKPWCKDCDVWFETDNSSGWVIRNKDATYQYNQQWAKILENTMASPGI